MKNPFFFSLVPYENLDGRGNSKETLTKVGLNTGNALFTSALQRVVRSESYESAYFFDPSDIAERHDGIIVSAANWLSDTFDKGPSIDLIQQTKLPVIIVGIGAQSPNTNIIPTLNESTERLVRIASETSVSISVRGDFSAEVLEKYGIKNVRVTGCPSLLYNHGSKNQLRKKIENPTKLSLNSTRHDVGFMSWSRNLEHKLNLELYRTAFRNKIDIVLQSETPDLAVVLEDGVSEIMALELEQVYDADLTHVRDYLKHHGKVFFGVEPWIEYLKSRDFVLGTRIHGSVASLLAGTPTVLITHDTRTEEMADALGVPSIKAHELDLTEGLDWNELYSNCDLSVFDRKFPQYLKNFREFFDENGLGVNLMQGEE